VVAVHSALDAQLLPEDFGATQVPGFGSEATDWHQLGVEQPAPVHFAPLAREGMHTPAALVFAVVQPEPFW